MYDLFNMLAAQTKCVTSDSGMINSFSIARGMEVSSRGLDSAVSEIRIGHLKKTI